MTISEKTLLEKLGHSRVLVIGDVMLDETVWGEVRRISPEAPVPVVEVKNKTFAPGGAANVAANIAGMGGGVSLGGAAGEDANADALRTLLTEMGADAAGILSDSTRPTTTKTRIVAHSQQIVRVDIETKTPISDTLTHLLLEWAEARITEVGAVVLSDYLKGVVTPALAQGLISLANRHHKPLIVDPKGMDYARYRGATLLTPNHAEMEAAVNRSLPDEASLLKAAKELQCVVGGALLVTRGAQGMSLFPAAIGTSPLHIPTVARNVYDVTGAGDTVVSVLALALAAGADFAAAATLANRAAGIVVGKFGTARVTQEELAENPDHLPKIR